MTDRGAIISASGKYRYALWRRVSDSPVQCMFLMLNPSTADANDDDPTVRRCVGYARDWGCGTLTVCNLFAWRSTDPDALIGMRSPVAIGPDNDTYIRTFAATVFPGPIICGWGAHKAATIRSREVRAMFAADGIPLYTLSLTDGGYPGHPLYLPKTATPKVYGWP